MSACSGELKFEEAKDILSKQRGIIKVYLPPMEGRYLKYRDDNNTIFDKLASEGYVEIIEDSDRPSNSEYDRRIYYRVRLTDKLSPYIVERSYIKIGELEVADIMGIKRVPADERLRVVEFTTRFVPNPIGEKIFLSNRNMQIEETKCLFEKHYNGWRLSLMPPDFKSRTETLRADMMPTQDTQMTKPALSPSVAIYSDKASPEAPEKAWGPAQAPRPASSSDEDLEKRDATTLLPPKDIFSLEGAERICYNAVLSMAIPVQTVNGTITYYVETADRTNILPYKDRFKRYGHRFCFRARGVAPGIQIRLSRSILCSIYKVGNEWQYDLKEECSFVE